VTAEAGKSAAVSSFRGFGTALPEHTIDGAQSLALLADFWPRLRGATPEPVTRHLVAPADWLMQPRSLGETMRLYGEHAPRLARLASCQALDAARAAPPPSHMVISVSRNRHLP